MKRMFTNKLGAESFKRTGSETMNCKKIASDILTIVQDLDEYADPDTHAEFVAKSINDALKEKDRKAIDKSK
jgi:hypothetical protein